MDIGLVKGERFIMSFRRHWFYLFPTVVVALFGILLLIILILSSFEIVENSILGYNEMLTLSLVLFSLVVAIVTRGYMNWYYNIYQITDLRIEMIRLRMGLKYQLIETVFDLVKSVEGKRSGIFGNIFNYGHIKIGTDSIASNSIFKIRYVSDPENVLKEIQKLIVEKRTRNK